MSRRVYLLGLGAALVALALAFTDRALSLRPGVTEANVKRIRAGMTLGQVNALLGSRPTDRLSVMGPGGPPFTYVWKGPAGMALVYELPGGRVRAAQWVRDEDQPGPLARLRSWLGW
jgi:hypothetical protein